MRIRRFRPSLLPVLATFVSTAAACSGSTVLPPPTLANVEDTVSLYALDGTPLPSPSGFNLETSTVVRTDRSSLFDFAFNITQTGQAVLLPTGAMGLGKASGLQLQSAGFENIKTAPTGTYVDTLPFPVDVNTVAVVRSRPTTCVYGTTILFYYAKLQVLQIDAGARRIEFRVLSNRNCGYRDLEPGLPSQ